MNLKKSSLNFTPPKEYTATGPSLNLVEKTCRYGSRLDPILRHLFLNPFDKVNDSKFKIVPLRKI